MNLTLPATHSAALCRLLLALLFLTIAPTAQAQLASYTFTQTVGTYTPITGGTVLALTLPTNTQATNPINNYNYYLAPGTIPFPFGYNGTAYTGGYISSKGYLTFGAVPPHTGNQYTTGSVPYDVTHPLSSNDDTQYEGAIAVMAANLLGRGLTGQQGELRYETVGSSPNREFVIQWSNVFILGDGNNLNFQIRLHETSNAVEFAYGACSASRVKDAQVGMRGYVTTDFACRTGASWAASVAGTMPSDSLPVRPGVVPLTGLHYLYTPPVQACPQPFGLVPTQVTGVSATLTWHAAADSTGPYQVVYGPAGFDPATGGTTVAAAASGVPISGLTPYTYYDYYVTQTCGGAAGTSLRSARGRFRTTTLNDDPIGAINLPITPTCQPLTNTMVGATPTSAATAPGYLPQLCGSTQMADLRHDVWFKFTTAATGPASTGVQLSSTGESAYQVRVFSSAGGAAGPFVPVFCSVSTQPMQGFGPVIGAPLSPNTTYYAVVTTPLGLVTPGPFTICASEPPGCGSPTVSGGLTQSDTTSTSAVITVVPSSGAVSYAVTYAPVGGGPTQALTVPAAALPITLTGLTPATNYNVTVQANCSQGLTSAVQTLVVGTRPANATAAQAQVLPLNATCQPVPGTLFNGRAPAPGIIPLNSPCNGQRVAIPVVWYQFTTPATGPTDVHIEVAGTPAGQVRVLSGGPQGPFSEVACSSGSPTTAAPPLDALNLTPATTYYLLVASYGGSGSVAPGPFTICLTTAPACALPANLGLTALTGTGATLSFSPGSLASSFTVALAQQGSPAPPVTFTASGTTGSIPLPTLVPGTSYTVTLTADCGALGQSLPRTIAFRTPGPPANDLCADARPLACGANVRGFFDGATATSEPTAGTLCGAAAAVGPGVWYRLAGTGQDMTFSTCGSPALGGGGAAHRLHVFAGSCGGLTCVGGSLTDLSCQPINGAATYTVATTAGTDYYVLVSAAAGAVGEFDLRVSCQPAGTCPPPTGVQVAVAPGGTSASVSFGAAPGAAGTVIHYGLAAGQSLAGGQRYGSSPAVLTNVQPGNSYVVTLSTDCGNGSRSVAQVVSFSTVLSSRSAALAAQLALVPNPAHHAATLVVPAALLRQAGLLTLSDALGRAVQQRYVSPAAGGAAEARAELDLTGLPPGVYWLRLLSSAGPLTKRLVVE